MSYALEEGVPHMRCIRHTSFNRGKSLLESEGYHIPNFEEIARIRIFEGIASYASRWSLWAREGAIYLPNGEARLIPGEINPIMNRPGEATYFHRRSKNFSLEKTELEKLMGEGVILREEKSKSREVKISTRDFSNNPIINYMFGKMTNEYGIFLREAGVKKMIILLDEPREKPYVKQAKLSGVKPLYDNHNEIYLDRDFAWDSRICGIK